MGDSLDVLQSVLDTNQLEALSSFLESCQENRAFYHNRESIGGTVGVINASLNESTSRERGILLLDKTLTQLTGEVLTSNLVSWVRQTIKGIKTPGGLSSKATSSQLLDKLLKLSDQYPEVRKDLALNVIPKCLETILAEIKKNNEVKYYLLENLVTVLTIFGRSCNNQKRLIEKVLLAQLTESDEVVMLAAQSYLQLAHVGGPSTEGINYKMSWKQQQLLLISALHDTLDKLFENVNEIQGTYDKYKSNVKLEGVEYSDNPLPIIRFQEMSRVYSSLTKYLATLYLGSFPVSKCIMPEGLLSVVCRCLAVTVPSVMKRVSTEAIALSAQLPSLHKDSFQLLDAFIKCCGVNLIVHVPIISRLFTQTLKWNQVDTWPYGQDKPFSSLRASVYSCLSTWLVCMRSCSGLEKHSTELVNALIQDIHYQKPTVTLNLQSSLPKGKSGKKRKIALLGSRLDDHKMDAVDKKANARLCSSALAVIPLFLEATASFIPPKLHKDLQEVIVRKLLEIQCDTEGSVVPYSDDTCRLRLYGAFTALCINSHPKFSAPIPFAVQILNKAVRDPSHVVSSFCSLAINIVEKIVRPSIESFLNIRTIELLTATPSLPGADHLTSLEPVRAINESASLTPQVSTPHPSEQIEVVDVKEDVRVERSPPFPAHLVDEEMSDFDVGRECNGLIQEDCHISEPSPFTSENDLLEEVCILSSCGSDTSVQVLESVQAPKRTQPSSEGDNPPVEDSDAKKIKLDEMLIDDDDEDDIKMLNSFVDAVTE